MRNGWISTRSANCSNPSALNDHPVPFLPYARQRIDDDDIAAVTEVLRADFLTTGPVVDTFETALSDVVGSRHAVACSSGTSALHLASLALGLGAEDHVIVPAVTFLATANAARYVGAEVVFADIDPDTGQMEPDQLAAVLATSRGTGARTVFPVCLTGQSADPKQLAEAGRGRRFVYDACHALGTTTNEGSGRVGDCQFADMTAFSFHPVKTIAMGEGGAVTTNDADLAASLVRLRNHGMTREIAEFENFDMAHDDTGAVNPWYYEMSAPGYNYRVTDIQCALGLSQLGKLARFAEDRRALAAHYDDRLAPLAPLVRPLVRAGNCNPVLHLYVARIDFAQLGITRGEVMRRLKAAGIGTQVHYIPVHLQPYYRRRYGEISLPGAEAYYQRALSLPLFNGMTIADVDRVVEKLGETLGLEGEL